MYVLSFLLISLVFLLNSRNVLLSVIVLEMITFLVLSLCSLHLSPFLTSDFLTISLFSVFVMEGVIALSGLIGLVTSTGSDSVSSSSLTKCQ